MKKIIAIAFLVIGVTLSAAPAGKILDTSLTPLDDTYAGSENEFIPGGTKNIGNIIVVNPSSVDIYACWKALDAASCTDDMVIPASSFRTKKSNYIRGLYLRAVSGSISSEIIEGTGE